MNIKTAMIKNPTGVMKYYLIISNIQGRTATYNIRKSAYERIEKMQVDENQIIKNMENKLDRIP